MILILIKLLILILIGLGIKYLYETLQYDKNAKLEHITSDIKYIEDTTNNPLLVDREYDFPFLSINEFSRIIPGYMIHDTNGIISFIFSLS